jgi:hypothetical protein
MVSLTYTSVSGRWALGLSVVLHIAALSAVVLMATPGAPSD